MVDAHEMPYRVRAGGARCAHDRIQERHPVHSTEITLTLRGLEFKNASARGKEGLPEAFRARLMDRLAAPPAVPTSTSDYYEGKSTLARPRSTNRAFQKEMTVRHKLTKTRMQMVFVMVGLPARGKSFISRRLESFLSWKGHTTRVFNVGKYRREAVQAEDSGKSDFFDPHNSAAKAQREALARLALEDMLGWLSREGEIGIFDATNSTEDRRQLIIRVCRESGRELGIVFIETLCTNRDVSRQRSPRALRARRASGTSVLTVSTHARRCSRRTCAARWPARPTLST